MDKHRSNSTAVGNRYVNLRMVGVMLAAIVVVALMSGPAFAHSGEEADAGRSIRADANPSMNVALWYVPPRTNGALVANRALNRDANPSMDVAEWYAPTTRANGVFLASRALNLDANPSMEVARWYGSVEANGALIASQALNSGANPSMNVALWYAPVQSDFEVLLCLAEDAGQLCQ